MSDDMLSQEEIDALLRGTDEEEMIINDHENVRRLLVRNGKGCIRGDRKYFFWKLSNSLIHIIKPKGGYNDT